jgi:hypothetical protein
MNRMRVHRPAGYEQATIASTDAAHRFASAYEIGARRSSANTERRARTTVRRRPHRASTGISVGARPTWPWPRPIRSDLSGRRQTLDPNDGDEGALHDRPAPRGGRYRPLAIAKHGRFDGVDQVSRHRQLRVVAA